jgi:hypothetical protein
MKSYSKKQILQGTLMAEFQSSHFKFFPDFLYFWGRGKGRGVPKQRSLPTNYTTGWMIRGLNPGRKKLLFSETSRTSLGSTQPPIQLVSGHISLERSQREARHPSHLVLRLRMCGALLQFPHMTLGHAQGQLYLFFVTINS